MPNQYSKLTKQNILRKVNRKKHPVRNMVQLAQEFGYKTTYTRWSGWGGNYGTAAPPSFRRKVRALVGSKVYEEIRDGRFVNSSYR